MNIIEFKGDLISLLDNNVTKPVYSSLFEEFRIEITVRHIIWVEMPFYLKKPQNIYVFSMKKDYL